MMSFGLRWGVWREVGEIIVAIGIVTLLAQCLPIPFLSSFDWHCKHSSVGYMRGLVIPPFWPLRMALTYMLSKLHVHMHPRSYAAIKTEHKFLRTFNQTTGACAMVK